MVSVETLEAWIKSLEKARAAHQSLSGLADDDDSLMSGDMTSMVFDEEEIFQVCDAFDTETTKRWKFQPTRRTFELDNASNSRTGEAKNRSDMLRQRYWIVHQRMQRLSSGTFGQKETGLTAIESLVGSNGVKRILGTISQIEEGKWFLEDPKSAIELDFSEMVPADIESGFFTEGSICVAEGEVLNDRDAFAVHSLKFGPAEPLELTRRAFPSTDFFGANLDHRLEERLLKFEESTANDGNDSFLLVSDVWLDDPKVWERLRFVVSGAASAPPFAIVFMGNFVSPSHATSISTYTEGFEKLADLLGAAPELLRRTRLVFVPGPTDLTPSRDVLPSPALVKPVREAFEKRLKRAVASAKGGSAPGDLHAWPSVHFTSNPTRIRYCTKQLVFFREDVTNKLRRHCFLRPSTTETGSLSDHLVRTLCDQSHLCPLPVTVKPIYWNYDHAMRLYPLPDFVRHFCIPVPLTAPHLGPNLTPILLVFTSRSLFRTNQRVSSLSMREREL